ncbi:hypothetical protein GUITHDRAFT_85567 [Guillardia theta CCMP2712]|uniref:tRNA 4-demethylwyosine synthase (AdoMet-dependent) n=2 Tax=Guillardia theta TaxID=55529 RepID=L1JNZ4_GUITC|nr:hypothetical protein GUITHDRAFT_85567 [Guillardia theta CCMP2712]EKX50014.1 hypothetical protein GUITHDRAFT_85567 [Guillardia theta CCMP2712]|eukprot:XP_005836994.1 hypothetical protein GUITHDRAFT_85567 [Guillardia theta CCMP2712]
MIICYGSQTGNAENFAKDLYEDASEKGFKVGIISLASPDFLEKARHALDSSPVFVFITSTWTDGTPPPSCSSFFSWLQQDSCKLELDFNNVKFTVFGLGNSEYAANFCKAARDLDDRLVALGGKRVCARGEEDDYSPSIFGSWKDSLWVSQGARLMGNSVQFIQEDSDEESTSSAQEEDDLDDMLQGEEGGTCGSKADLEDLEDLGKIASRGKEEKEGVVTLRGKPKKMLNPSLEASLTKQGYKLVGSHSGVKLCRWTKSMLRGRGGCYKHTFYGIASYQCMEATPSLACANKCVFCWRHHKNPVGTSWRWETDDPQFLVDGFVSKHRAMIKEMRGLPGVIPERLEEADTVRHCALSLVGEPIIYPHINKFINLLHEQSISTFLVSNAQFPSQMENLVPCTQLYVSIDASNAEELKAVDRPLFSDFWERFLECIDILDRKGQRTVFRLTLVKSFNMSEVEGYANLIRRGRPDFVEIKGVTFTGGKKPQLGMSNVPWHAEVVSFASQICKMVDDEYEIASEHAHSCAILLANKKFKRGSDWYTWIDYPKFFELVRSGQPFTSLDYMTKTPEWAVYGRGIPGDGGFDPAEIHYRKGDSRTSTPMSSRPDTPSSMR